MTAKFYGFERSFLHDTTEDDAWVIDMVRASEYVKLESEVASLQERVRALAAEVSECRRFVGEELGPDSGIQFSALSAERSDEVLREIRADGAAACGVHLREWYDYQVEQRAEEFAAAIRSGERP